MEHRDETGDPSVPAEAARFTEDASMAEMRRIVKALYDVHQLLGAITDLDTLLQRINEDSRRVARAEASSVILFDPGTDELYFQSAVGEQGDQDVLKREIRLKMGQGIAGATAATRKSIIVTNAQSDPRFFREADAASQFQTRDLLAVPMLDRDRLVGVLEVVNKTGGGSFTMADQQVLEMFSSLAATAVTNARLIEERVRNEKLAAVGQAVAGLSHYIKNIVSGLNSSSDLMEMGIETCNQAILSRTWPVYKRSTKRMSNFVQDMLSFSKPRKPIRESCRLATIVGEAHETFRELFVQKKVTVRIEVDRVAEPQFIDAQAIYRCLLNLLMNAADAVPERGGAVTVSAKPLDAGGFELCVDDNGPGVPAELAGRIFDPFFSTKGSRGTGLGLAVTRKIVREHGGDVTVETREGSGARFRVRLPAGKGLGDR